MSTAFLFKAIRADIMFKNNRSGDYYTAMKNEAVIRMMADSPLDIEDEDGVADPEVYMRTVSALVENTEVIV